MIGKREESREIKREEEEIEERSNRE